jgi:hypothetical protein
VGEQSVVVRCRAGGGAIKYPDKKRIPISESYPEPDYIQHVGKDDVAEHGGCGKFFADIYGRTSHSSPF